MNGGTLTQIASPQETVDFVRSLLGLGLVLIGLPFLVVIVEAAIYVMFLGIGWWRSLGVSACANTAGLMISMPVDVDLIHLSSRTGLAILIQVVVEILVVLFWIKAIRRNAPGATAGKQRSSLYIVLVTLVLNVLTSLALYAGLFWFLS